MAHKFLDGAISIGKTLQLNSDDAAAGIGGLTFGMITAITTAKTIEVVFYSMIGGFVGIIAKKAGEMLWYKIFPKQKQSGKEI